MAYLVLARKYRPIGFDDFVGQEVIAETLRNAIRLERVAHAYLFCGPRGVGKTSMARVFALKSPALREQLPVDVHFPGGRPSA